MDTQIQLQALQPLIVALTQVLTGRTLSLEITIRGLQLQPEESECFGPLID